ncbi:MAG: hypothetical protein KTU85_10765 [Acidimicrobiia bacterium]|nr:hypothetical protein [Acidimicrobiia bacterium]
MNVQVERAWWGLRFQVRFLKETGDGFEDFIRDIMRLRFPDEYTSVKPAGREGDWKNDGLLTNQRRLLQVYAPEGFDKRKTLAKINADYSGAVDAWGDLFDTWTFVTNSDPGLPPYAVARLQELSDGDGPHKCEAWDYGQLRRLAFELDDEGLTELLGAAVTITELLAVEVRDVIPMLRAIEVAPAVALADVSPVPPDKLDANGLTEDAELLLLSGMRRAPAVQTYFDGQPMRPLFRDDLGTRFSSKYQSLRDADAAPDEILAALVEWVAGPALMPVQQAAALAVVAFFFEQCDIFEDATKVNQ